MERVGFSFRRLWFIACNTLREAVRQKVFTFLLLLALVVMLGVHSFRDLHFGSPELKFIADLGLGVMAGFGAVLAVVATTQLFFSEIERRTVQTLLAKPVWRAEFVLGKFVGAAVLIGVFCGLLTVLLAGVLWARESALMQEWPEAFAGGRLIKYGHLAVVGLLQGSKLLVLAALTLLVASYAQTQLFTMVTGFLVFVMGHLQHLAQAAGERAGASAMAVISGWVARALPNFQLFNLGEILGGNGSLAWSHVLRVMLYGLGYAAAACALAVFCFRRREF